MMNGNHVESQAGFTLMELLLAMVLSVIVITAMSAVFRSVVDSSVAVDAEMKLNQEGRVLVGIMQKDLSSMVISNSTSRSSKDDEAVDFNMSAGIISFGDTFMTFTTTNDLYSHKESLYPLNLVSYTLSESEGGCASLIRSSRKYSQLTGDWEENSLKLTDRIAAMRVELTGVDAGLTIDKKELLEAETVTVSFSLRAGDSVREFSMILPARPAVLAGSEK